jgi:deoxyribodipyrimidine photo-lyase
MEKPFSIAFADTVVDSETTLVWLRRDLRIEDNTALYFALKEKDNVLPIFIFDTIILDALEDTQDRRVEFIRESLLLVKDQLEGLGSSLLILYGDPVEIFKHLRPKAVYVNRDYEPYARRRDESVRKVFTHRNIEFREYKDQVVFDTTDVLKNDGTPYTIFTPYSRQWKFKLSENPVRSLAIKKIHCSLKKLNPLPVPSMEDIGFSKTGNAFPVRSIKRSVISKYHETRNIPSLQGTSRLGVHIRFGTVSIRKLVELALKTNETWLNELIWREFFSMILYQFPRIETEAFKPAYDNIVWRNNEREFHLWCEGKTGYPLVDAGMRELNETGFMHNRVRMVAASFLSKHLLIDWRWGEAYFARKLLDFDLASNNGGWQWAAGCGCDAAPYFRVFNPILQLEKFDKEHLYVKKWIPEYGTNAYPAPIVEHTFARERVLKTYQKALKEDV